MLPTWRFDVISRAEKLCLREGWKRMESLSCFRNEMQWHAINVH